MGEYRSRPRRRPRLGAFSPGIFEGSTAALSANPHWFVGSIPANTSFEDEDE
jgi:hypothetical protein